MASMDASKVVKRVYEIVDWANYNGRWPNYVPKPRNENESLGNLYYNWLTRTCYNRKNLTFVYAHIKMPDDKTAKEVLDEAYKKWEKNTLDREKVEEYLKMIRDFCAQYNIFPSRNMDASAEVKKKALKFVNWLDMVHFQSDAPKAFLYKNLVIDGEEVYKVLNDLYKVYYKPQVGTRDYVLARIRDIKKYCRTYKEWPKYYNNPGTIKETEANFLAKFLDDSDYQKEDKSFKYSLFMDEKGMYIEDILNKYYAIFGENVKIPINMEELNIWKAKDSKDVSVALYYYILKLVSATDFQIYQYYLTMIDTKIKQYNLNLKVNEILRDLMLGVNEQVNVFYDKYIKYNLEDDKILSKLYYQLYLYSKEINLEVTNDKLKK